MLPQFELIVKLQDLQRQSIGPMITRNGREARIGSTVQSNLHQRKSEISLQMGGHAN